jgi:rare lipoprotein A
VSRSAALPGLQPNWSHPQALPPARSSSLFLPAVFCLIFAAGCAHRTYQTQAPAQVPQPAGSVEAAPSVPSEAAPTNRYVEQGVASWYGPLFNGRRTSDGEIYNMHEFTAAHRTLPFNSVVRVTNLSNGMQTEVRINDRGPFVANRVIDLSLSAARAIGMVGPGTAPVRLDVISGPDPQSGFFAVQVGSFRAEENAEHLRRQLAGRYSPAVTVPLNLPAGRFYRVRVGRFANESAARALAEQIHATEQLIAFVVRLDN